MKSYLIFLISLWSAPNVYGPQRSFIFTCECAHTHANMTRSYSLRKNDFEWIKSWSIININRYWCQILQNLNNNKCVIKWLIMLRYIFTQVKNSFKNKMCVMKLQIQPNFFWKCQLTVYFNKFSWMDCKSKYKHRKLVLQVPQTIWALSPNVYVVYYSNSGTGNTFFLHFQLRLVVWVTNRLVLEVWTIFQQPVSKALWSHKEDRDLFQCTVN